MLAVAAAIIAGGLGRRMGGPSGNKGALLIAGRRILDRQLEILLPRFARVLLVANEDLPAPLPGVAVIPDRVGPGLGPLAGLDAALSALLPHEQAVVCVGGDMPLLAPGLIELVRDTAPQAEAVVPRIDGRAEPLLARYSRTCAPRIAAALAARTLKTSAVVASLAVHWIDGPALRVVDPDLSSFENANTPADLARIAARLEARGDPRGL
jgi:molybdopterin-guanine dinucleotide biosynthesis protein A